MAFKPRSEVLLENISSVFSEFFTWKGWNFRLVNILRSSGAHTILVQYEVWLRSNHWFKEWKQIGSNYQMVISVNCRNADQTYLFRDSLR